MMMRRGSLLAAASITASITHAYAFLSQCTPQLLHLARSTTQSAHLGTRHGLQLHEGWRARIYLLNRLLVEPSECEVMESDEVSGPQLVAHLSADDPRTVHVRTKLKGIDGQAVRAGVLDGRSTDEAKLRWLAAAEDGTGQEKSTLRLNLGSASLLEPVQVRPRVDVILAMPRPLQFARMLPMLSSLGIGTLWVTGARRVEKNYFSCHLLRAGQEADLRTALVEGLVQSGDTAVPRVVVCRNLPKVLREYVGVGDALPPLRLACHPERLVDDNDAATAELTKGLPRVRRLRDVIDQATIGAGRRIVLAIGPERGWEEPEELHLLVEHGFELVTLGPRTLRTDVACVALLAVTHDLLDAVGDEKCD